MSSAALSIIDRFIHDLKTEVVNAVTKGEFSRAEEIVHILPKANKLRDEVAPNSTRHLCVGGATAMSLDKLLASTPNTQIGTKLRVAVAGEVIEAKTGAMTFVLALERMGIEKISHIGLNLSGIPLVSREPRPTSGYQSQTKIGPWYVTTHSNTATKKKILEELATMLSIVVKVEIV